MTRIDAPDQPTRPNTSWRRAAIAVPVIVVAALIGIRLASSQAGDDGTTVEDALPVSVTTVRIHDSYQTRRVFTGRIAARRASDLGFEQAGLLEQMLVDEGDRVGAGDVLARLDTDLLRAERDRLLAERADVTASLDLARSTLKRVAQVHRQGHASAQAYDEAVSNERSLEAGLNRVTASLAAVQINIEKAELKAPFDGRIERRTADEGTVLAAGTPVLRLLETGTLEARIGMPVAFGAHVERGGRFLLRNEADAIIDGRVKSVNPAVRGETRTVIVSFTVAPGQPVVDGELVSAELIDQRDGTGFWLPLRALTADVRGLWRVYKAVPDAGYGDHRVVLENVQILHVEDDQAFVTGTLEDGDLVVDGGVQRIVPGKRVEIVSTADQRLATR